MKYNEPGDITTNHINGDLPDERKCTPEDCEDCQEKSECPDFNY
jgi:hypothetical protein